MLLWKLWARLLQCKLGRQDALTSTSACRDVIFLDIALEGSFRRALEVNLKEVREAVATDAGLSEAVQILQQALHNASLSAPDDIELLKCKTALKVSIL